MGIPTQKTAIMAVTVLTTALTCLGALSIAGIIATVRSGQPAPHIAFKTGAASSFAVPQGIIQLQLNTFNSTQRVSSLQSQLAGRFRAEYNSTPASSSAQGGQAGRVLHDTSWLWQNIQIWGQHLRSALAAATRSWGHCLPASTWASLAQLFLQPEREIQLLPWLLCCLLAFCIQQQQIMHNSRYVLVCNKNKELRKRLDERCLALGSIRGKLFPLQRSMKETHRHQQMQQRLCYIVVEALYNQCREAIQANKTQAIQQRWKDMITAMAHCKATQKLTAIRSLHVHHATMLTDGLRVERQAHERDMVCARMTQEMFARVLLEQQMNESSAIEQQHSESMRLAEVAQDALVKEREEQAQAHEQDMFCARLTNQIFTRVVQEQHKRGLVELLEGKRKATLQQGQAKANVADEVKRQLQETLAAQQKETARLCKAQVAQDNVQKKRNREWGETKEVVDRLLHTASTAGAQLRLDGGKAEVEAMHGKLVHSEALHASLAVKHSGLQQEVSKLQDDQTMTQEALDRSCKHVLDLQKSCEVCQAELAQQAVNIEELTKQLGRQEEQHRKLMAHAVEEAVAQSTSVQLTVKIVEANKVELTRQAVHMEELTKQLARQEEQHQQAKAHAAKLMAAQSASVELTLTVVETNKVSASQDVSSSEQESCQAGAPQQQWPQPNTHTDPAQLIQQTLAKLKSRLGPQEEDQALYIGSTHGEQEAEESEGEDEGSPRSWLYIHEPTLRPKNITPAQSALVTKKKPAMPAETDTNLETQDSLMTEIEGTSLRAGASILTTQAADDHVDAAQPILTAETVPADAPEATIPALHATALHCNALFGLSDSSCDDQDISAATPVGMRLLCTPATRGAHLTNSMSAAHASTAKAVPASDILVPPSTDIAATPVTIKGSDQSALMTVWRTGLVQPTALAGAAPRLSGGSLSGEVGGCRVVRGRLSPSANPTKLSFDLDHDTEQAADKEAVSGAASTADSTSSQGQTESRAVQQCSATSAAATTSSKGNRPGSSTSTIVQRHAGQQARNELWPRCVVGVKRAGTKHWHRQQYIDAGPDGSSSSAVQDWGPQGWIDAEEEASSSSAVQDAAGSVDGKQETAGVPSSSPADTSIAFSFSSADVPAPFGEDAQHAEGFAFGATSAGSTKPQARRPTAAKTAQCAAPAPAQKAAAAPQVKVASEGAASTQHEAGSSTTSAAPSLDGDIVMQANPAGRITINNRSRKGLLIKGPDPAKASCFRKPAAAPAQSRSGLSKADAHTPGKVASTRGGESSGDIGQDVPASQSAEQTLEDLLNAGFADSPEVSSEADAPSPTASQLVRDTYLGSEGSPTVSGDKASAHSTPEDLQDDASTAEQPIGLPQGRKVSSRRDIAARRMLVRCRPNRAQQGQGHPSATQPASVKGPDPAKASCFTKTAAAPVESKSGVNSLDDHTPVNISSVSDAESSGTAGEAVPTSRSAGQAAAAEGIVDYPSSSESASGSDSDSSSDSVSGSSSSDSESSKSTDSDEEQDSDEYHQGNSPGPNTHTASSPAPCEDGIPAAADVNNVADTAEQAEAAAACSDASVGADSDSSSPQPAAEGASDASQSDDSGILFDDADGVGDELGFDDVIDPFDDDWESADAAADA